MAERRNERFDIQGINHLALVCRDTKATVDFYSGVLGMPLIRKYLPRDVARRKLGDMVAGRNLGRRELGLE